MANILIVEDDADLVETYTDLLEARGHSVSAVGQIQRATLLVSQIRPEIVTLDLNLPGGSAATITAFIHTAKVLNHARIIIISGHSEMMTGSDWESQVDLMLTKPVDNQMLTMMVDRLLIVEES